MCVGTCVRSANGLGARLNKPAVRRPATHKTVVPSSDQRGLLDLMWQSSSACAKYASVNFKISWLHTVLEPHTQDPCRTGPPRSRRHRVQQRRFAMSSAFVQGLRNAAGHIDDRFTDCSLRRVCRALPHHPKPTARSRGSGRGFGKAFTPPSSSAGVRRTETQG